MRAERTPQIPRPLRRWLLADETKNGAEPREDIQRWTAKRRYLLAVPPLDLKGWCGDVPMMEDERIIEQGRHLFEELAAQRQQAGRKRFWCPVALRARIVAYTVACSADGKSHRCVAEPLGMRQRTLSRWIRTWRHAGAGVRQDAIGLAEHRHTMPPASHAPLRLVSRHGYVIAGLNPELLVSLSTSSGDRLSPLAAGVHLWLSRRDEERLRWPLRPGQGPHRARSALW